MIRLSWRQSRTAAVVALVALVAAALLAALTGPDLARRYAATVTACQTAGDCTTALQSFARTNDSLRSTISTLVAIVPALLGAFWGAPLIAREVELGTLPLVWTQSVTRSRWLVAKLTTTGLAAMVTAGLMTLVVTWWARPLDRAGAAVYTTFGSRHLAPVGYAVFALALGVAAGLLIGRTVPAMAATVFGFTAVRIGTTFGVRPRMMSPLHLVQPLDPSSTGFGSALSPGILLSSVFNGGPSSLLDPAPPDLPNAWIYSVRVVDGSGHDLTNAILNATCPDQAIGGGPRGPQAVAGHSPVPQAQQDIAHACVTRLGATYHELVTYQPASRYWILQWEELALYCAAALLLGAFCLWWVRRHQST